MRASLALTLVFVNPVCWEEDCGVGEGCAGTVCDTGLEEGGRECETVDGDGGGWGGGVEVVLGGGGGGGVEVVLGGGGGGGVEVVLGGGGGGGVEVVLGGGGGGGGGVEVGLWGVDVGVWGVDIGVWEIEVDFRTQEPLTQCASSRNFEWEKWYRRRC